MIRPIMKSDSKWYSVGSFLRPGLRLRFNSAWSVFWTAQGYELSNGGVIVRHFKYLREAKQYAWDCEMQSKLAEVK